MSPIRIRPVALLALSLLTAALLLAYWYGSGTPQSLAARVSRDLSRRVDLYEQYRKAGKITPTPGRASRLPADELAAQSVWFSIWSGGRPVSWNGNALLINPDSIAGPGISRSTEAGRNIVYAFADTVYQNGLLRRVSVTVPLARIYPLENAYLNSFWYAGRRIPVSTTLSFQPLAGYVPVTCHDRIVGYIHFPPQGAPTGWMLALLAGCGIVALGSGGILTIRWLRTSPSGGWRRFGLVCAIVLAIEGGSLLVSVPAAWKIPALSATETGNLPLPRSWADFLLQSILLLALVQALPARAVRPRTRSNASQIARALLLAVAAYGAFGAAYALILHSGHGDPDFLRSWSLLNLSAISGLLLVPLALMTLCRKLLSRPDLRTVGITAALLVPLSLLLLAAGISLPAVLFSGIWMLPALFLARLRADARGAAGYGRRQLLVLLFSALGTALLIQLARSAQERRNGPLYARMIVDRQDPVTEFLFPDVATGIGCDPALRRFIDSPTRQKRLVLNDYLERNYLNGHFNKYSCEIYIYRPDGTGLINPDTTGYTRWVRQSLLSDTSAAGHLFYRPAAADGHFYLGEVPVISDSTGYSLASVFIDMTLRRTQNQSLYPELLKPAPSGALSPTTRDYAVYHDGQLYAQTGSESFPLQLRPGRLPADLSIYRIDPRTAVLIARPPGDWKAWLVQVAFVISIQFILYALWRLAGFLRRPGRWHSVLGPRRTLRSRIRFTLTGIILLSFGIIAGFTVWVSNAQYRRTEQLRQQELLNTVSSALQQFFSAAAPSGADALGNLLERLSQEHKVDVNLFDANGRLYAASQDAIYKKLLLARVMDAGAWRQLRTRQGSALIRKERIGNLSFLSGYRPLRNERNQVTGYVNIPYFSSEKEWKDQLSAVLVSLVTIYIFLFLLSGVASLLITNQLTASLGLVIQKFRQFDIRQSERIEWPYQDEIGVLIDAYNKMAVQVAQQAANQAQHERELAWREMARQVAHEIKNPLTPMKLHIQYLQQAIAQRRENVPELAARTASVLIEQIENLNYIASEFSSFAQTPGDRPEKLSLNNTVAGAAALFASTPGVRVEARLSERELFAWTDAGQLLRVCTNLIQNAVQAVQQSADPKVEVTLSEEGGQATITVTDNGAGVAPEVRERLFEPYFTTKNSGTGLGLAISRKIAESWGGTLGFEPRAEGGAVFRLSLPLVD